jgi:hypothetical protein
MKAFLTLAVLSATAAFAPAQQRPPAVPPVRIDLSIDAANKTVTVPPDWTVLGGRRPLAAPPVRSVAAPVGYVTYDDALAAARAGEVVTVFVGVNPKPVAGKWASTYYLEGITPGVYTTRLGAAGPELVPVVAVSGVAGPVPFGVAGTTQATTALPVAGVSTSRSVGFQVGRTRTVVPQTAPFGGIMINGSGGCANGQCGAPEGRGLFGGFFRR